MSEQAVVFGDADGLVGVVTDPPTADRSAVECKPCPAVILFGAGFIHRVGPNRLNVKLARRLAARGFTVLRFDLAGFGDSAPTSLPLAESAMRDTIAAMDFLAASRGAREFLLVGLCSGAACALYAAWRDRRVVGAALLNPRPRHSGLFARLHQRCVVRKYRQLGLSDPASFLQTVAWKGSLKKAWRIGRAAAGIARGGTNQDDGMQEIASVAAKLHAMAERGVRFLVVASEWDQAWDYVELIRAEAHFAPRLPEEIAVHAVAGADHTFTLERLQQSLFAAIDDWSGTWTPALAQRG
jgi:alpha-beta hydrolase superfamily lysophospholipase